MKPIRMSCCRPPVLVRPAMVLLVLAGLVAVSVSGPAALGGPLSPANASYEIEVTLDPVARTLVGKSTLIWRNIQAVPTSELWFHLYWNGWRNNRSTWILEDQVRGRSDRGDEVEDDDWSYLQVTGVRLRSAGSLDLLDGARYASPDDGNRDDRTVLVVSLPEPVKPGGTVRVEMDWKARIPRTFARTGYRGDYYFIAHWFPKLGVWEGDGWNCHQYHAATEYYSDYGDYSVAITLPVGYEIGATGRLVDRRENADGSATHLFEQQDVHAFTWTASRHYRVFEETFDEAGLPPVEIRLLMQPEHLAQTERHFAATRAALKYYGLPIPLPDLMRTVPGAP